MKENEESNEAQTSENSILKKKNSKALYITIFFAVIIIGTIIVLSSNNNELGIIDDSNEIKNSTNSVPINKAPSNPSVLELCGKGICYEGLNAENCPGDCHPECGTGIVEPGDGKTWTNCRTDLRSTCGDAVCQEWEHYVYCPEDCEECIDDRLGVFNPDELYPVGPDNKLVPVCPLSERLK